MSSLKVSRFSPVVDRPASAAARRVAAAALRSASAVLARRVAAPSVPRRSADPQLEFYAEAGAPEGALYLDGLLVGRVEGVRRL